MSAKRAVPCVADSLADLCAGGRAGSVESGRGVAVVVRISCAMRARSASVRALLSRGLGRLAAVYGVFCAHAWSFCAWFMQMRELSVCERGGQMFAPSARCGVWLTGWLACAQAAVRGTWRLVRPLLVQRASAPRCVPVAHLCVCAELAWTLG